MRDAMVMRRGECLSIFPLHARCGHHAQSDARRNSCIPRDGFRPALYWASSFC